MMPTFHYRVLNKDNEVQTGVLEAADLPTATAELHGRGWRPLELSSGGKTLAMRLNEPVNFLGKPNERDVFSFLRDLARLLKAGLSMDDALRLLIGTHDKELFVRNLEDIRERVRRGESLGRALAEHKHLFSVQVIASVQAGETSGTLPEALDAIAGAMDRSLSFKERLRSALIYPAILMAMVCMTFVLVMTFVLPQFAPVFVGNEDKLPWVTRFVLALSSFFSEYLWIFSILLVTFIAWVVWVIYTPGVKADILRRLSGLPAIRSWMLTPDIIRFVRTLGVCTHSGLALDKSIAMAIEAIKVPHLGDDLRQTRVLVRRGELLSVALAKLGWMPSLVLQFARVGEQSGNLGAMLEEAASITGQDFEAKLEKGLALLSPVLTLIMGGLVALLVGSVLLGIMSINNVAL
ncbi:MAG: type II secretion system F family protein [Alphaproteobacteria bacterium]|nr:type II secretion system F family protein [Alphaproteobacteria bacterium]